MAIEITSTTQLSTYSLIQSILLSNSTLSQKFNKQRIYEFEPNLESISFDMLPYIVVNVPTTDTDILTLNHDTNMKTFNVQIVLVMDWIARGNFTNYCNAIIRQIESSVTTLEAAGYYNQVINLDSSGIELIKGKQVVVGNFTLTMTGSMERD